MSDAARLEAQLSSLDDLRAAEIKAAASPLPAHWSEERKAATAARHGGSVSRLQSGVSSLVQSKRICPAESVWGAARQKRVDAGDVQGAMIVELDWVAKELRIPLSDDPRETALILDKAWQAVEAAMEEMPDSDGTGLVEKDGVLYLQEETEASPASFSRSILIEAAQDKFAQLMKSHVELGHACRKNPDVKEMCVGALVGVACLGTCGVAAVASVTAATAFLAGSAAVTMATMAVTDSAMVASILDEEEEERRAAEADLRSWPRVLHGE
mmetsp:Transcript_62448/g.167194  ORF Transcript_62448/g.167194 Transcript_62448/m.167194 type:complete len:270 (+) Transcript_62448:27-836(+)